MSAPDLPGGLAVAHRPVRRRVGFAIAIAGLTLAIGYGAQPGVARAQTSVTAPETFPPASVVLDTTHAPATIAWVVLEAFGEAVWRLQASRGWQRFKTAQVVPAGSEIETGPDGWVVLVTGGDRLIIGANTRIVVAGDDTDPDQRLRQERGRVRVDVEERPGRAFRVRTPLLSLGIKGTSFEVVVDPEQDSILVLDGQVAVMAPGASAPIDLGAGEGLQQSATPDVPAVRLAAPDLPPIGNRAAPLRWYLPEPGETTTAALSTGRPAEERGPMRVEHRVRSTKSTREQRSHEGWLDRWLDDPTSLLSLVLVAAGAALVLIGPGMTLLQNLRNQARQHPPAKGRRRQALIRDA